MSINVDINIYINDTAYSITNNDYFKIESALEEMQELINNNQFKSDNYNNLKKLFTSFLKSEVKKTRIKDQKVTSDIYYYTY